jgi:hypothetical protein
VVVVCQFSHDRSVLASIAHDTVVRLWDMRWVRAADALTIIRANTAGRGVGRRGVC